MYRTQEEIVFYLTKKDLGIIWDNNQADTEWENLTQRQRQEARYNMINQIITFIFNDIGNDCESALWNEINNLSETYQQENQTEETC